jgi:anaerobic selenocysteine-containing dehydrogenase
MRSASLQERDPELFVEINPLDALEHNIETGDVVVVSTRRGQAEARARITDKVKPGVVFMPFHYHGTNILTSDNLDPIAKIPEYKMAACRIDAKA